MKIVPVEGPILIYEAEFDYSVHATNLSECIVKSVPESHSVILVDDASLEMAPVSDWQIVPFLERDGIYNGFPVSDTQAISELERMRTDGCEFIIFAKPSLYWLDHYARFRRYLCEKFPCVAYRSEPGHALCVIFDLRRARHQSVVAPWRLIGDDEFTYVRPLVPERKLQEAFEQAIRILSESIGLDKIGSYLEFGVFVGTSMATMHAALKRFGLDDVKLFGFDSFKGLPDETTQEDVDWKPGEFSCDLSTTRQFLKERATDPDRVCLIDGWFQDTLNQAAIENYGIGKASIIMVDCDIYASTADALRFCAPLISDQSIIFFDDWNSSGLADRNMGQKQAFDEFLAEHNQLSVDEVESYSDNSAAFSVTRL